MPPRLAVLYEHPSWFAPLFAALDRRGIAYRAVPLSDHRFDPAANDCPARVIFSRVAMSGFLREDHHGIFYAQSLLAHWESLGARVVNGPAALAIDASKARQASLIAGLGLAIPATRVVHRPADIPDAAADLGYPVLVKPNIGGSGAGILRFDDADALARALADDDMPGSIDGVWLVQDFVPARGGAITRIETLAGRFLYAIDVAGDGGFDLCPADACLAQPGRAAARMTATTPAPALVDAAERIARAAHIEVGGVELLIDDRDGTPRFYDINALSNFVADPMRVLGWDPHERLIDYLATVIEETG